MTQKQFSSSEILEGKIFALLSYLSILCIIPLILKKENVFVLAHGKQGLVLFVGEVAVMVFSIVIPGLRDPFLFVLFLLSFWGLIEVIRGRFTPLPIVAGIADKITL